MAGLRKRKHAAVESQPPSKQTSHGNIKAFANVTKAHKTGTLSKKIKTRHDVNSQPAVSLQLDSKPVNTDRKRKRQPGPTSHDGEDDLNDSTSSQGCFGKLSSDATLATPRTKRLKNLQPPSPAQTPSKKTTALFSKLNLKASSGPVTFPGYETPPHTPNEVENPFEADLPGELQDLAALYSAFLTALSLHYAHNGVQSSVDTTTLLPMVTKTWRKRDATLDDLRLLLAMATGEEREFVLRDVGKAGICLTRVPQRGSTSGRAGGFIEEAKLASRFEDSLRRSWTRWQASSCDVDQSPAIFIRQLPRDAIEAAANTKIAPSRGQQRLLDIKNSQNTNETDDSKSSVATTKDPIHPVHHRGADLLDRILAKQAAAASLPAGPSKQQLERKAALHRIEEIARVLDLLVAGRTRCSFSMQAMVQQLQQSLRNPISREEVDRCLSLMASEITPGFVSLIKSGSVTGFVVTKAGKVEHGLLRRRLQAAGA